MRRRFWLGLLLAVLALGSLCAGRYGSSLSDIARALLFSGDELTQSLVWNLRMPRILLVSISGAALAVSGVVYQTIFRNPLASGDVIGASSGCSLGAVFAILFYQESWFIELCAFLTGMLLVILTFLLASRVRGNRILNLVVAGLILQAVATSLMMMMKLYADPATQLANMEYWLMGGFSDASWSAVLLTLVLCTLGMSGLYLLRWQIQLLSFGEEAQESWFIELCAFLTGMLLVILTFLLASRVRGNRILNLVVAGLILQAVATSLMMMMKLYADPATQLANMEYWLMGGFSDASWSAVLLTLVLCTLGMSGLYLLRWQIQLLSFGEEASTLGVNVKLIRWVSLLLATLLISSVISVAGIVSWVSLLIPHIIRIACRKPISQTMGITAVSGAIFLLLCDTLARTLMTIEIPISILTSLFGALALVVLFVKGRLRL